MFVLVIKHKLACVYVSLTDCEMTSVGNTVLVGFLTFVVVVVVALFIIVSYSSFSFVIKYEKSVKYT